MHKKFNLKVSPKTLDCKNRKDEVYGFIRDVIDDAETRVAALTTYDDVQSAVEAEIRDLEMQLEEYADDFREFVAHPDSNGRECSWTPVRSLLRADFTKLESQYDSAQRNLDPDDMAKVTPWGKVVIRHQMFEIFLSIV